MGAGQSLAQDIENGFFSRLVLTPMRPTALMAGQLAGLVLLGRFQALLTLGRSRRRGISKPAWPATSCWPPWSRSSRSASAGSA